MPRAPKGLERPGAAAPSAASGGSEWTSRSAWPRPAATQSLTPLPPRTILGQITGQGEPRCGAQASSRTRMTGTPLAERPAHMATPCTSCRPRGVMQGSEATTHDIRGVTSLTPLSLGSFPGCGGAGQVVGAQSVAVSMGTVTPRPAAQGWVTLSPVWPRGDLSPPCPQPPWARWTSACSTTRRTTRCTAPSPRPR